MASDRQADAIKPKFPSGIAKPALRALASAGLYSLEDLTEITEAELSALHGMGPKAIGHLISALHEKGLALKE
jgi:hypothetical protein